MVQKLKYYMSPEKEAYIRQVIKKTKELGHEVLIQNGEPEYDSPLDWKSEEGKRKFEEFQLDREALGQTVLHLIDVVPDYRYWPTLFGFKSENWYRIVNFDISIVDTNNNLYVWISIDHDDATKDDPAFERIDEEELKEILSRPMRLTLETSKTRYVRSHAYNIERHLIHYLHQNQITIKDLCDNFSQIYLIEKVGKRSGNEIYKFLTKELNIPRDRIKR